jgi:hypothetical protein
MNWLSSETERFEKKEDKYFENNYITRLKSKSNVLEKRGNEDEDLRLISFSNSFRRRMFINEEKK